MDISIMSLRDYVGDYDFQICTENNTDIAEKCLERAKVFVKSLYKKTDKEDQYSEYDDSCKEAILLYASSELYVKGKRWDDAEQKRKQAQATLVNVIGNAGKTYDDDEVTVSKIKTVISVRKGISKSNYRRLI